MSTYLLLRLLLFPITFHCSCFSKRFYFSPPFFLLFSSSSCFSLQLRFLLFLSTIPPPPLQTWIISNSLETPTHGSLYRRTGITPDSPAGVSWDKGIGIEWNHVTTRGCIPGLAPPPPSHPPPTDSRSPVLSLSGINLGVSPSPEAMRKGLNAEDHGDTALNSFTSLTARRRRDARRESADSTDGLL